MQAVRMGQWKGVKNNPDSAIDLYNLLTDPAEKNNLAPDFPEIVQKMSKFMALSHKDAPAQVDMPHDEAARLYIPGRK